MSATRTITKKRYLREIILVVERVNVVETRDTYYSVDRER